MTDLKSRAKIVQAAADKLSGEFGSIDTAPAS